MSSCIESTGGVGGGVGGGAVVAQTTTQAEQLCYIPCNFCNIVLAVSVPCNNMMDIVMVRCGHCGNLWSVNMAAAALHSVSSTWLHHRHFQAQQPQDHLQEGTTATNDGVTNKQGAIANYNNNVGEERMENMMGHSTKYNFHNKPHTLSTSLPPPTISIQERVVNRPPEKRQRVPSAYNQFIKEEIQRIKANNPDISHREAFSTAAKNWAHFPHIHFGLMLETNKQG